MKIVFASNYYNHHQSHAAREFDRQTNHNFYFIETAPMEQERKKLGWGNERKPDYVLQSYLSPEAWAQCQQLINDADVVIWGSCPFEMIRPRLKMRKLTFRYSERLFKSSNALANALRAIKYNLMLRRYSSNHYLLCASAYAAEDYNKIGLFKNRTFRWGYFPETKIYESVEKLISEKEKNSILWVARFIEWKHPEMAVELAKYLRDKGYAFKVGMIGTGPLEKTIKQQIEASELSDYVHVFGSMPPEEVREYMEKSDVFIFTSDKNEGWGAVLNEAMNSACTVVANREIGSVPFVVDDQKNGFIYDGKNADTFFRAVERVLNEPQSFRNLKENAYHSIIGTWNASVAVSNFMLLTAELLTDTPSCILGNEPCARL